MSEALRGVSWLRRGLDPEDVLFRATSPMLTGAGKRRFVLAVLFIRKQTVWALADYSMCWMSDLARCRPELSSVYMFSAGAARPAPTTT